MNNIVVIDNFFERDIFYELTSKIYNEPWTFGSSSNKDPNTNGDIVEERINGNYLNPNSDTSIFWNINLMNNPYFKENIFQILQKKLEIKADVNFIYANGQTFGQGGDLHIDDPDGFTFLLFCNRIWKFEWGGKTAFIDRDYTTKYIEPKPNRIVFFPGSIMHRSEEVSKQFTGLRITLAYKLKL